VPANLCSAGHANADSLPHGIPGLHSLSDPCLLQYKSTDDALLSAPPPPGFLKVPLCGFAPPLVLGTFEGIQLPRPRLVHDARTTTGLNDGDDDSIDTVLLKKLLASEQAVVKCQIQKDTGDDVGT
jgi:hypothetical protein